MCVCVCLFYCNTEPFLTGAVVKDHVIRSLPATSFVAVAKAHTQEVFSLKLRSSR